MADRLRAAVIGVGAMGANHARVYQELPDTQLVALADSDQARLRETSRDGAVRLYGDYDELLARESLDLVSVAVPTRQHLAVGLAVIERGVPVLIEKPLAAGVAEAEQLRDAARAAGVPLLVGHVERFNPAVQEAKQRLAAGALGSIYQARARRAGPFFRRERDVGVLHDLATHDIDVLRHLLGSEVERVQAETLTGVRTEHEDALAGLLRFESGVVATLDVNWLSPVKVRELVILGERGLLELDYLRQELRYYPPDADGRSATSDAVRFPGAGEAPLRAELAAFARVARGLEPPPVGAGDGIAALLVADALVEAARRGAAVALQTAPARG